MRSDALRDASMSPESSSFRMAQGLYSVSIVTAGEAAFVSSVEIREEGGAL